MKNFCRNLSTVTALILVSFITNAQSSNKEELGENAAPVNYLREDGLMNEWNLMGAFPNQTIEKPVTPDGALRSGFHKDYLEVLGGEANAVIKKNTTVKYQDEHGNKKTAETYYIGANRGVVNFDNIFPDMDYKVAYAYSYIHSPKKQLIHFYFGSDDCPKIWINNKLVHKSWMGGRGLKARDDYFTVNLHKGLNSVLIKVEEGWGSWQFILEAFDENAAAKIATEKEMMEKRKEFQNCELRPKGKWDYMFKPGDFPEIVWEEPYKVEKVGGDFPLNIRWFNGDLKEISKPDKPGRYLAYVEGESPLGFKIRRALTLYCRPENWQPWEYNVKAHIDYIPDGPINKEAWDEREKTISSFAGVQFIQFLETGEKGAILMAYLHEMKPLGRKPYPTETPEIINADYHLALKRKILGVEGKYRHLQLPKETDKKVPVLRAGTAEEAGIKKDAAERIHSVCREWYKESKEPFVVLVARHGIIIIHEAFDNTTKPRVRVDTPLEIASISKSITGLMFAQFVDQGLIGLDDPVGKYLPDFPVKGDKVITLRQCFTHTTGLEGHFKWGGVHNPWLDNVIANGLNYLKPGKAFSYEGMGCDLAGKVMELVSGKSTFRLFHENFFKPLSVKNTRMYDLACDSTSTAEDIAKIGQFLLNRGSYGNLRFFSTGTMENLLPQKLNKYYPGVEAICGIGLEKMSVMDPDAGKSGIPEDKTILSKNMTGHGAGCGSIFRVDFDNDLVIVQVRNNHGEKYDKYFIKLLKAIEDSLL